MSWIKYVPESTLLSNTNHPKTKLALRLEKWLKGQSLCWSCSLHIADQTSITRTMWCHTVVSNFSSGIWCPLLASAHTTWMSQTNAFPINKSGLRYQGENLNYQRSSRKWPVTSYLFLSSFWNADIISPTRFNIPCLLSVLSPPKPLWLILVS